MPYITRARRSYVPRLENAGDLAYSIAQLMETYRQKHGDCFQTFADIDAANRAAMREFERKVIGPYEDIKMVRNGPVFAPVSAR